MCDTLHARLSKSLFLQISVVLVTITGLGFATPLRADDDKPKSFDQLGRQLRKEYDNANYEGALKTAEKMHEMRPKHMETMYNMACLHSLLDHKDKAYDWLEKAIDAGYDDPDGLLGDSDFSRIRAEDRFRKIVKRLRSEPGKSKDDDEKQEDDEDEKPRKSSSKEEDDKDEELSGQEAAARVQELTNELIESAESKDYDKALKIAKEAYGLSKKVDNPSLKSMTAYNMACMHSLREEKDEAFKYLTESLELGGGFARNIVSQMENDGDLDNIRKDQRYAKLLAKAKGQQKVGGSGNVGRKAESKFEIRPPKSHNKGEAAPLLVVLHGHGENLKKAEKQWAAAADESGAVLLSVQGSKEMSDGLFEWGDDVDEIEEELMGAIDQAIDQYKIDKKKIVIAGFSQGGWIAYAMALRNPDTFRGIIPVGGLCKPESESAFEDEDVGKLRLYIIVGKKDESEILQSNQKAAKKFEKAGAKVSLNEFKNVAHEFPPDADEELAKGLEFVLRD